MAAFAPAERKYYLSINPGGWNPTEHDPPVRDYPKTIYRRDPQDGSAVRYYEAITKTFEKVRMNMFAFANKYLKRLLSSVLKERGIQDFRDYPEIWRYHPTLAENLLKILRFVNGIGIRITLDEFLADTPNKGKRAFTYMSVDQMHWQTRLARRNHYVEEAKTQIIFFLRYWRKNPEIYSQYFGKLSEAERDADIVFKTVQDHRDLIRRIIDLPEFDQFTRMRGSASAALPSTSGLRAVIM